MITIATHSGGFHADDVFAVATLKLYIKHQHDDAMPVGVTRTRNQEEIDRCEYAVDVGGVYDPEAGRFDHHQIDGAGKRENGVPYAAFGLVWKEYGATICESDELAEKIDRRLVQSIDGPDNGVSLTGEVLFDDVYPYHLQSAVGAFQPTWKESAEREDKAFAELVEWATILLHREISVATDVLEGEVLVEQAYEAAADKRVIYLDQSLPWQGVLMQKEEPLFVAYPKESGRWRLRAVPAQGNFQTRAEFPENWRGKHDKKLQEATGVDSAVFCHKSLPMIVTTNKEGIDRLVQQVLT